MRPAPGPSLAGGLQAHADRCGRRAATTSRSSPACADPRTLPQPPGDRAASSTPPVPHSALDSLSVSQIEGRPLDDQRNVPGVEWRRLLLRLGDRPLSLAGIADPSPRWRISTTRGTAWGGICNACKGERSEEHTSELQSLTNLVCRLLLEKK